MSKCLACGSFWLCDHKRENTRRRAERRPDQFTKTAQVAVSFDNSGFCEITLWDQTPKDWGTCVKFRVPPEVANQIRDAIDKAKLYTAKSGSLPPDETADERMVAYQGVVASDGWAY